MRITELKGLGPASEKELARAGIYSADQLLKIGAMAAYLRLAEIDGKLPSMNLLYALVGAVEERDWTEVAQTDRLRLLMELEGFQEARTLLDQEGVDPERDRMR